MRATLNVIEDDAVFNEAQASQFLGLSVRTLQAWRVSGCGPKYLKMQRSVRYRRNDLAAFAEQCAVQSTTEADAKRVEKSQP